MGYGGKQVLFLFGKRAVVPAHVVIQEVEGESVLLMGRDLWTLARHVDNPEDPKGLGAWRALDLGKRRGCAQALNLAGGPISPDPSGAEGPAAACETA